MREDFFMLRRAPLMVLVWVCLPVLAWGQFKEGPSEDAKLGEAVTHHWRVGVVVNAASGPCRGIVGSIPIPAEWPEQQVRESDQEVNQWAKMREQDVDGVKMMLVTIPNLPAGQEAKALVTFEVVRNSILAPTNTDQFKLPENDKIERSVRQYLSYSPLIESRSPKIVAQAKQIISGKDQAWQRVEALYDWVRENVEYKNKLRKPKGALVAMQDKQAGHEDLASLFIALCRAAGIPARTVWVPGFCYPEFYLIDDQGKGQWFPCQVAGERNFGQIPENRPILQKGDDFRSPTNARERVRYLPEGLTGKGGKPSVEFVRELVEK